jgi:class 3 adenylate cyclase/tRNA A-37 threonylcarbamoyl transferase component Bud32
MSPLKLAVRALRVLSGLLLLAIVLLFIPAGIPYLENASSYGWIRTILEWDEKLIGGLKSVAPTKFGNFEAARWILMALLYALSRVLEGFSNVVAKKATDSELKRRYEAFKASSGLSDKSRALAPIRKKMEALKPGDAKSRDELIALMIETKKKLDSMSRDVAFLAIDVVGSTDMKLGEDKAFIEHDFREYKKLVESVIDRHGALKSAWTPDGVMICFGTVDEAIRSAQEVLIELQRFNQEVKSIKGQFRVRCGINAGHVHYDKAQRMEEMSDRVIDVAGHMQKYAAADTIFIARDVLEKASDAEGFKPADQEVDGFGVYLWKAPSADPTMIALRDKRAAPPAQPIAEASSPGSAKLTSLRELTNPGTGSATDLDPFAPIAERTQFAARAFPEKLGKYELQRELGRGAMGIVYEGWDPSIERRVAIKTIRQDQLDSNEAEEILARFQREAKAAGRISHPNIVAVYELGHDQGMYFIAMEYVEGRELKDYFDKGERFPLGEVVRLMGQLLEALDVAGRKGIVHRDIKPANLILLPDGTLKVADFGIARIESSQLTQTGAAIGTPTYMSPEQLLGQPVDGRSDLFSAGVVLYQFLTGEKPFTGERATTVITKVLSENPPAPSTLDLTLPRSFDAVARKALGKKPDERFQNGREFADALKAAYDNREKEKPVSASGSGKDGDDATLVTQR